MELNNPAQAFKRSGQWQLGPLTARGAPYQSPLLLVAALHTPTPTLLDTDCKGKRRCAGKSRR